MAVAKIPCTSENNKKKRQKHRTNTNQGKFTGEEATIILELAKDLKNNETFKKS